MGIPVVLYFLGASQALPLFAVWYVWGRRPPAPHARLAILCLAFLCSDVVSVIVTRLSGYNRWVPFITQPVEVALTLWVLSAHQVSARWRDTFDTTIKAFLGISVAVLLFTDPAVSFDRWIGSLQALVALAGTLFTLVARATATRDILTGQDWFWITSGLALFWLLYVSVDVFANSFLYTHVEWARAAYLSRAYMLPVCFAFIAWGVLCQRRTASPGLS